MKTLTTWNAVGEAVLELQRRSLPLHETPQKNWDHYELVHLLNGAPRNVRIADLGCGDGHTLWLLRKLGYTNIVGCDLRRTPLLLLRRLWGAWRYSHIPFEFHRESICKTSLPAQSVDFAVSISVIEHGVDIPAFARECRRILKPGGTLFLTTDYWPEGCSTERPGGIIFDRQSLAQLRAAIADAGFRFDDDSEQSEAPARIAYHQGFSFTFCAMTFTRV